MFDAKNTMAACDPRSGCYLTVAAMFGGRMSTKEVEEQMLNMRKTGNSSYGRWIPDDMKADVFHIPSRGLEAVATLVTNTTAIPEGVQEIVREVHFHVQIRALLDPVQKHGYVGCGFQSRRLRIERTGVRV
jgi:hypothetical protein